MSVSREDDLHRLNLNCVTFLSDYSFQTTVFKLQFDDYMQLISLQSIRYCPILCVDL